MTLNEMESNIEQLEIEIAQKKRELNVLKEEWQAASKPAMLEKKIRGFEARCPDSVEATLERMVREGETFEEWYERWGSHVRGDRLRGKMWTEQHYRECKKPTNYYAVWLIEADDPKIRHTQAYADSKKGE